jgi:hypothetical protein
LNRFPVLLCVMLAFCVAGCDQAAWIEKFVSSGDESVARSYAQQLRERKFDQIKPHLDPAMAADAHLGDTLAKMAALFPDEDPQSIKVVGAHATHGTDSSSSEITLEYQFSSTWLLVQVATITKQGTTTITGFHVLPLASSVENSNAFTLRGKSARQYLTLLLATASFLSSLYVFVLVLRATNFKRKWLWAVIALVGVCRFAVNWSTGEFHYTALAVQIPCGGASRPFYGPWTIAGYFPLGALLILQKRRKSKMTGESNPSSQQPAEIVRKEVAR